MQWPFKKTSIFSWRLLSFIIVLCTVFVLTDFGRHVSEKNHPMYTIYRPIGGEYGASNSFDVMCAENEEVYNNRDESQKKRRSVSGFALSKALINTFETGEIAHSTNQHLLTIDQYVVSPYHGFSIPMRI